MSERQAGYAPQDGDEDSVRVKVQVQAPDDELEDLAEVIVERLEGVGLVVAEHSAVQPVVPERGEVELRFARAAWLG